MVGVAPISVECGYKPPWVRCTNPVPPDGGIETTHCVPPWGTGVRQHAKGVRTQQPGVVSVLSPIHTVRSRSRKSSQGGRILGREEDMSKLRALIVLTIAAMLAAPGTALAAIQEHLTIPVEGMVFAGDEVCGETLTHTDGNLHILISYTENDNRVSGTMHFQPQGAKLVDESGRTYSGTGVGMVHFSEPFDDVGAAVVTTVDSFKFIGHGKTPNVGLQLVTHVTMTGDGTTAVEFEYLGSLCE